MSDLMRYAAALDDVAKGSGGAPVDKWNPAYCGELDLIIRRDGLWIHEGTPIGRAKLVRLFSSVIKREGDRYYLVTPVEKLGIKVEDAPFLAVLMRVEGEGDDQDLVFTTNVGDEVTAGPDHKLTFRPLPSPEDEPGLGAGGDAPYLHVRRGLEARIARAVYYDLAAIGETRTIDGEELFGAMSGGEFFSFGSAGEVFGRA